MGRGERRKAGHEVTQNGSAGRCKMAALNKFKEIALQKQWQAKETAVFEVVMMELGSTQSGSPVRIAPVRRRSHKTPMLSVKFDGEKLEFFLAQVMTYMQEHGPKIATEGGKVYVTKALERMAVRWMVIIHNDDAPELRNFNHFMVSLCKCFEDPLIDQKDRDHIKTIHQG
ncbi:neuralized-like 4 [Crotalus adamanteus]|uniref:Neuralized-like 4 n=1 Tax=Crotalus adamanteus TaxID=8729 RepID=A0AAW1B430_CROAD